MNPAESEPCYGLTRCLQSATKTPSRRREPAAPAARSKCVLVIGEWFAKRNGRGREGARADLAAREAQQDRALVTAETAFA